MTAAAPAAAPAPPSGRRGPRLAAPRAADTGLGIAILLVGWEVLAWLLPGDRLLVPSFTATVQTVLDDRALLLRAATATVRLAATGLVLGFAVGAGLAVLAVLVPALRGTLVRLATAVFCIPLVTLAPVLQLGFDPDGARVALAAVAVSFVSFVAMLQGLTGAPPALHDLVRSFGGSRLGFLVKVRCWWALPQLLAALRIAGPAALLGAMLAEYFGADRGLGALMIVSLSTLNVTRAYAIALVIVACAAVWYLALQLIGRWLLPWTAEFARGRGDR